MRATGYLSIFAALLAFASCAPMATDTASSASPQAEAQRRADIRLQLASAYFAQRQYVTALNELDKAYQTGERRADVLGLRALVLMQQGDNAAATRSLKQALQADPENPGLLNNMGWLLCETGRPDEGLVYLRRALAIRGYASPARAMVNAGRCSLRIGKRDDAVNFFSQALVVDPAQTGAHAGLARLAYALGDYTRAKAHMLRVLAQEPVARDDYLMAISIERQLGDHVAESSLAQQWKKRFPGAASLGSSPTDDADER